MRGRHSTAPDQPFRRCRHAIAVTTAALLVLAGSRSEPPVSAQAPQGAPLPSFEVASVKPNKSGEGFIRFGMQPGGRFTAVNAPLRQLIVFAYTPLQPFQIEGGPGWINSDRFDVTAKAEGVVTPIAPGSAGPIQQMMQSLLAERFKLVAHRETKEQQIYTLVLARSDGRLGKQIQPATTDCAALAAARGRGTGPAGPPQPPPPGGRPECGLMMGPASFEAGSTTLTELARLLSQRVNRVVVDKTGLTGRYDFNVEFTPDQMPPQGAQLNGAPFPAIDPNGPSIFTALQEQLGLKLESGRGPVEMLVIDSVEPPLPD
jgi:uncharacterized protein (TIGR03435 family)